MPTVLSLFGIQPRRIGGQEAFARELSSQLADCGWRSVLCFDRGYPESVRKYLELPNVSLEIVNRPEAASWDSMKELARLLRRYRPEILHLYYTGFVSPYPWLARVLSADQVLFTDTASRPEGYSIRQAPFWKRVVTRLINYPLDKVTCVSEYLHRCWLGLDVLPASRFTMIYNAVGLDRASQPPEAGAEFRRRYSIPADHAIASQVSWIIPEKGIVDLLHAARIVVTQNPKSHFVLVGEGKNRQEYAELARTLGIADQVTWTGNLEDPFAAGVYAATDVACQLSRWEEAFGYVIAEAMASCKPVIGTRVGGIPELVQDGETGFLVTKGDTAQVADRILALFADQALRKRMGIAGRRRAEQRFDLRKNVAQLIGLYGLRPGRQDS